MSITDNTVVVCGNVTRDPELRFTQSGIAVCNLGVAQNQRRKNSNGEWEDGDPSFFNVTVWRELGENTAASIQKGHRINIIGRLVYREYTDKDENARTAIEIVADEIGPSLRWGTTEFNKQQNKSQSNAPTTSQEPPPYVDEEPF